MGLPVIYRKYHYNIYLTKDKSEYILHNTKFEFDGHHTHLRNFKTAKYILNLALHKNIPKHICDYFIISLLRVSDDDNYKKELNNLLSINRENRKGTTIKDDKRNYYNKKNKVKGVK